MQRKAPIARLDPQEVRLGFTPSYQSAKFAVDTDTTVSIGSRLDKYYKKYGFKPYYKGFSATARPITPAWPKRASKTPSCTKPSTKPTPVAGCRST
ncbi:hypothetical protein [Fibrella aquatilis]|uniref:Uncharacterized protein n=1 Tax=Fibrella aquatilis TaxID=2817059 RepID=A0A939G527_9BACT|nr:hypothetical protein [Fibrella aquatilis]MBO0930377.1 hypothetical protein [Fibrella aquatilis]